MLRVADACAGTGSLSAAVAAELGGRVVSVSDTSSVARRVLAAQYPEAAVCEDALSQDLSRADAVAIGAPCQDLSLAGPHKGAAPGSGTRSALIWPILERVVAADTVDLVVAENVLGGRAAYSDVAQWLRRHGFSATLVQVSAADAGAPHLRRRLFVIAARRGDLLRDAARRPARRAAHPARLLPTVTASASTGPSRSGRSGGPNLQTAVAEDRHRAMGGALDRWAVLTGRPVVPAVDSAGRLSAGFCEWMMGTPPCPALSRTARIRLAGNAVVPLQARLALRLAAKELLEMAAGGVGHRAPASHSFR